MDLNLSYTSLTSRFTRFVASIVTKRTGLKIVGAAMAFIVGSRLIRRLMRTPFPGPKAISVICLPFMSPEKQVEWLTNIANNYGKISSFRLFFTTVILISDAKVFHQIAKKRPKVYSRAQVPNLLDHANVAFAEGDAWKVHRKIVSRPLIESNVNSLLPTICSVADSLIRDVHALSNEKGVVSRWAPEEHLVHGASQIASAVYLGEANPQQSRVLSSSLDLLFTDDFQRRAVSFVRRELELSISSIAAVIVQFPFLTKFHPRLRRLLADWNGEDGLKASWQGIIEYNLVKRSENPGFKLPSILEHAGKEYDMKELMSTLHMFLGAGSDTVAGSLSNLLKYMSLNPDVQERARGEALTLKRDPETPEELDQLVYLRGCILESLRLNILGPVLPLVALHDSEIDGKPIKAGTRIVIMLKKIQEDSYEQGAEFRPERWLSEDGKKVDPDKFREFTGFGDGPRICPGRHLAMKEMLVYASRLLRHFRNMRLAEVSIVENKFTSIVIMHPQGLYITMEVANESFSSPA
ncbi:hypothetical protein FOL47_011181 [Perkinsus chesapeaki]|uniref:Cytochrome P450-dit2 n=1 Tax=Perkinsus chesapeaki TaxID=330153 RepID=A0A7J6KZF2_PERCH|nr:hypothetical protein FOL47_011181 [Perkinsus chesapeaki]